MLAIVIPFFKITYFDQTLRSLSRQTNKNFNVYIGDDASALAPVNLIDKYKGELNIVYKRFEENVGKYALTIHWQRCIDLTKDEKWIMILGDDDYISENYIQEFYNNMEKIDRLDIKVVRFATRVVREPHGEMSKLFTHPEVETATDFFYKKFLDFGRGSLSEQIFRRDAFNKHGFRDFPLGWGADNFAWLDFTEFGNIYTINNATAFFRISNYNISRGGYKEEVKQQTKYRYFTIIIEQYLVRFKRTQRVPLLLFYEQVTYESGQANFGFWKDNSLRLLKEGAYLQILKFLRRIIIHKVSTCPNS